MNSKSFQPARLAIPMALIALTPTLAAAWGKTSYYSYSSDRSASYTTSSNDDAKGATAETTASISEVETSQSGDDEAK